MSDPLRVDVVSDVVCPWCVIGYRQLAQAAEAKGIALDVYWHPFELNPAMAEAGENLGEHLAAKYGTTPEQSRDTRARMEELGNQIGFTFRFSDDMQMWNTFRAHQLIDWAQGQGAAHAVKQALFAAHFTEHRNVSDPQVLAEVAAEVGLDRAEALAALTSGAQAAAVREKQQFWTSRGVQGVPAMIFASKYLVTGAQGADGYSQILDQLTKPDAA